MRLAKKKMIDSENRRRDIVDKLANRYIDGDPVNDAEITEYIMEQISENNEIANAIKYLGESEKALENLNSF